MTSYGHKRQKVNPNINKTATQTQKINNTGKRRNHQLTNNQNEKDHTNNLRDEKISLIFAPTVTINRNRIFQDNKSPSQKFRSKTLNLL